MTRGDAQDRRDHRTYAKPARISRITRRISALLALGAGLVGAAQAEPLRIIAFGDSLTAGYQLPADAAFPAALERRLRKEGYDVKVVNSGVSGETTGQGAGRIAYALRDGGDLLILELGANDNLRGLDPAGTRANLERIIAACDARGTKVLLAGMVSIANYGEETKQAFDAIFPALAAERRLPLYPFFLEGVLGVDGMTLPDGLHPSRAGVERIVEGVAPLVAARLDAIRAEKSGGAAR
ncbi:MULTISPECIES: arylesterase [Methylosinus]|uniref:Arylesterase n=1 Tax=Methylosinus trichosporium (strain ATCC 35070 / NCIMB 11131 / UNIQEM 75 / OB3b) TaxID=595536 RepID=A0A2D2CVG4_METT3|nr:MULTISPECIES: arylesterase [Methylosinus]ATQ66801.1 arylesterase [Methylosinus trichosporium OB3b]